MVQAGGAISFPIELKFATTVISTNSQKISRGEGIFIGSRQEPYTYSTNLLSSDIADRNSAISKEVNRVHACTV